MTGIRRLLGLLAVILVVAAAVVWQVGRQQPSSSVTVVAPPASTSAPVRPPSPSGTGIPRPTTATAGGRSASPGPCATAGAFVPTRFSVARLDVAVPVVPVDEQSSKGTMAPPIDRPWEVAWIDTTNKPGSRSPGVINLTAHTYHAGGAIGNSLYRTDPLRPGDLIVLSDGAGRSACYRYTRQVKFAASTYSSNSTVFYDQQSAPQLRLMICWDYNRGTKDWDSRVVFYADQVTS